VDPNSIAVKDEAEVRHVNDLAMFERDTSYVMNPPVYVIAISQVGPVIIEGIQKQTKTEVRLFMSTDKILTGRIARAYIHAIVLCGGGKNQPF
jgi:hypothetical protein